MRQLIFLLVICTIIACDSSKQLELTTNSSPRLLITTDIGGDPDDTQSMVRLLVYANEFKLEGLVASASGTVGEVGKSVVRTDLLSQLVEAYGQVCENLKLHDERYPSETYLKSIIKAGNPNRQEDHVGDGHLTEGSEWIIQKVDESDEYLNVAIWGGQTDVAQALWQVKNSRSKSDYQAFIAKMRIHDIADQDSLFDYIHANHPDLFYIRNRAPLNVDKRNAVFRGMYLEGNLAITSLDWLNEHVIEDHGPLGALYPKKTWTAPNPNGAMKEGDTPSWYYFLRNGLNMPDKPQYGGWGGRFERKDNSKYYYDAYDTYKGVNNARVTVARWREDFQNDFAARMDRCVLKPEEVNHPPMAVVNGILSKKPLIIKTTMNKRVTLDASASHDPDGHEIQFEWMVYKEAGHQESFDSPISSGPIFDFEMPKIETGKEIHVILRVKDDGNPQLSTCKRLILRN